MTLRQMILPAAAAPGTTPLIGLRVVASPTLATSPALGRLAAAGAVALVSALLLGLFSGRVESALAETGEDDIDIGLFGRDETGPMPAAQALTEKIPTRRPEPPPQQP